MLFLNAALVWLLAFLAITTATPAKPLTTTKPNKSVSTAKVTVKNVSTKHVTTTKPIKPASTAKVTGKSVSTKHVTTTKSTKSVSTSRVTIKSTSGKHVTTSKPAKAASTARVTTTRTSTKSVTTTKPTKLASSARVTTTSTSIRTSTTNKSTTSVSTAPVTIKSVSTNPVMYNNFPDPGFIEVDGVWYAFATRTAGTKVHFQMASSPDFKTWKIVNNTDGSQRDAMPVLPAWVNNQNWLTWAPDVVQLAENKFVMYFTARYNVTWNATSDSPPSNATHSNSNISKTPIINPTKGMFAQSTSSQSTFAQSISTQSIFDQSTFTQSTFSQSTSTQSTSTQSTSIQSTPTPSNPTHTLPAPHQCVGYATADNILGPYTGAPEPLICPLKRGGAIDPGAFTDVDGKRYIVYKIDGNALGHGGFCGNSVDPIVGTPLMLQELAADGVTLVGKAIKLLDNNGLGDNGIIEAPSLVRSSQGNYFLFFSSGCFSGSTYTISYATSTSLKGNYTRHPSPLMRTGTGGFTGPGGASVKDDGHMVFASFQGYPSLFMREMHTGLLEFSNVTAKVR
ncbi:glycoside hydrolase family 43 protein [Myriangium duriaei CBS 260.36]|uniref:Glycoside hydrolase family 43 protein n=1 Tax=Myriangium duriaei CBS 260.36 TaxID=1168546 RepID=A0A9P4MSJ1_9PEZI|nr:glycoside hydrolase family 43 protein [Myriangium duriaei CBS 260.36]